MTRLTVPPEELGTAVALRRMLQNSAQIAGLRHRRPARRRRSGPGWAIAVDAATFAVAAVCFSLLRVPHTSPRGCPADLPRRPRRRAARGLPAHLALAAHRRRRCSTTCSTAAPRASSGRSSSRTRSAASALGLRARGPDDRVPRRRAGLPAVAAPARPVRRHRVPVADRSVPAGDGVVRPAAGWCCSARSRTASGSRSSRSTGTCRSSRTSRRTSSPGSTPSTWSARSWPARSGLALTGPVAEAVGFDRWLVVVGLRDGRLVAARPALARRTRTRPHGLARWLSRHPCRTVWPPSRWRP